MKKIYFSILSLAGVLTMNSQTLNQANHAPTNGDTYSTQQCDSTVSPGAAGASVVWNFANLTIHTTVVSNYTTSNSVVSAYPSGSQVTASNANDLAYTLSSANDLKYYGGNIKVETVAAKLTYAMPAMLGSYPMSLNTNATSAISGTIDVTSPQATSGSFTGNSMVKADGSGTLILPGGTGGTYTNVLRVSTTQTLNFSVGAGFVTGTIFFTNYNYYSPGIKAPLLTMSVKTVTSNVLPTSSQSLCTINKDYLAPITISINENKKTTLEVSVYPNPSASYINFVTEQVAKGIEIFDITGKMIEKQNFNNGNLKLDVSAYNSGFYLYNILDANGETVKTGKITVNQ